ncbi:MAG: hypothetical protein IPP88_22425 [Betaproteobacteria bacterium]|nr:hypothetical protein [Betaproteobacteria bacterium]
MQILSSFEHSWFDITKARNLHQTFALPVMYTITNDNRWHQHHLLWDSTSKTLVLDDPIDIADMAGCRDLADVFSSCNSDSDFVNICNAWRAGKTSQIGKLVSEKSLDMFIPVPPNTRANQIDSLENDLIPRLSCGGTYSVALSSRGLEARGQVSAPRTYFAGMLKNEKPLLAATKVVVFPWFDEQLASLAANRALQCVVSGKVCVLTNVVARVLQSSLGDLILPNAILVSDMPTLVSRVQELVQSRDLKPTLDGFGDAARLHRWFIR